MNIATRFFTGFTGALLAFAAAGCGNKACEAYCDWVTVCAGKECKLKNPDEATSACMSACTTSYGYMDDKTADAVATCMECLSSSPECHADASKCKAACDNDAVEKGGSILEVQLDALRTNDAIACTNGENPFGGGECSGGSGGDGINETCDADCENGSARAAAQCSGPTGDITCVCTAGTGKGKSFSIESCAKIFEASIWDRCNP